MNIAAQPTPLDRHPLHTYAILHVEESLLDRWMESVHANQAKYDDEYLLGLSQDTRAALQKVRRAVHARSTWRGGVHQLWHARVPAEWKAHRRIQSLRKPLFFPPDR